MRRKFSLLVIFLIFASISNAASISYRQYGNPNLRKKLTDVTLVKIDSRFVSFIHKGKEYKINRKWMDSFIPDTAADNGKDKPLHPDNVRDVATKSAGNRTPRPKTVEMKSAGSKSYKTQTAGTKSAERKSFPTKLAAYVLHCRYLFGAGQSDVWYYGKQVVVSGVVSLSDIKRVRNGDLMDRKYAGQYQVPMVEGGITCITGDNLSKYVPKKNSLGTVNKRYLVMKFSGTVTKSTRYKEAFIADAKLISVRSINKNRASRRTAGSANPNERRIIRSYPLSSADNLKYWAFLEQKSDGGIGRVQCDMGDDPEAYAMEIYWLSKLNDAAKRRLNVNISGVPYKDGNGLSRLRDCAIVSWSTPNW